MIRETVSDILRTVVSTLQVPVIVVLLIMLVVTIATVGSFIMEYFSEHRQLTENIPELVEKINDADSGKIANLTESSGLLNRQKLALSRLLSAENMSQTGREAYAAQLLFDEEEHYRKNLRLPETLLRLGPMFGLLGTLIPLGPGLIALGKGNTQVLSESLLTAFDTTALGVMIAAVAFVIYQVRKGWYRRYAQGLESIMEAVLEKEEDAEREEKNA